MEEICDLLGICQWLAVTVDNMCSDFPVTQKKMEGKINTCSQFCLAAQKQNSLALTVPVGTVVSAKRSSNFFFVFS